MIYILINAYLNLVNINLALKLKKPDLELDSTNNGT